MNNLEEMDRFLEKFNLPRLNEKEIQRIIRDYYKQLYANKMDKMTEMGKY